MRWGYGDRRRSCDGEEGGEGKLDAPRMKNGERTKLATASDGRTEARFEHGGGTALGSGDGAVGTGRGVSDSGGGAVGTTLSGRRRTVPTAHLTRWSGAARGSHVATVHCRAGLTRTAASDRWDPLVSVFRIKITPDDNRSK
jgi:hypothetical protein